MPKHRFFTMRLQNVYIVFRVQKCTRLHGKARNRLRTAHLQKFNFEKVGFCGRERDPRPTIRV